MNKFKTFLRNYSISIGACVLTLIMLGTWHIFANPTKTIIGDDVIVSGNLGVGVENPQARLDVDGSIHMLGSPIIESGSNWVRYADGTQICWGNASHTYGSGASYGNIWWDSSPKSVTFPIEFSSNPVVSATGVTSGVGGIRGVSVSTSGFTYTFWNGGSQSNFGIGVHYIAIGKWK